VGAAFPALAHGAERRIAATGSTELAPWATHLQQMADAGEIRLTRSHDDPLVSGRRHQRLAQMYGGVPVFGGELVVQTADREIVSVFGTLYEGIALDTKPALSPRDAEQIASRQGGVPFGREGQPELLVFPLPDGRYALTYEVRVERPEFDLRFLFIDAKTGAVVEDRNALQTESAVGVGTGVLGDRKKVSANHSGTQFLADDRLRPPRIATFDFHGDFRHFGAVFPDLFDQDLARDADNTWDDRANVDAHTYAGYTYDYYYKRFGRQGLDNANVPIRSVTHVVNRADISLYPDYIIFSFYLDAFYIFGEGTMIYGEGLPDGYRFRGRKYDYLAGALDLVAHEFTHGVTNYTSNLTYQNESGALNESFSDMMGTAVEFFYQPAGSGPLHADYLLFEDVITPGGIRSLANPAAYGFPDHYSLRRVGSEDNGFVHTNSSISNHAYYLAIEGGTNRVSGIHVTGVGSSNRDHIEKVFYRAFTEMLPASASFSTARAATIQAARDLYGAGSATETAVTQAWTAVGVN
jgi:bacillolysin